LRYRLLLVHALAAPALGLRQDRRQLRRGHDRQRSRPQDGELDREPCPIPGHARYRRARGQLPDARRAARVRHRIRAGPLSRCAGPAGRTRLRGAAAGALMRVEIERGLAALGLEATPEAVARLAAYLELIGRWNQVYNLTAITEPGGMVRKHLLDSLAPL